MGDSDGFREIRKLSPDSEAIREALLAVLHAMPEAPRAEYPDGVTRDENVTWQLGELRETRAIEGLKRVAAFWPEARGPEPFPRTRKATVALAEQALAKIEGRREIEYTREPADGGVPHEPFWRQRWQLTPRSGRP